MYSNCKLSCCCTDTIYLNNCCHNRTPYQFPTTCCCCPVCHKGKRVPRLSKSVVAVPTMKPSNETSSNKNSLKTKNKTPKSKRGSMNSVESQVSKEENTTTKFGGESSSLSQTFVSKKATRSEGMNKPVDNSNDKQSMNLKGFVHKSQGERRTPDSRHQPDHYYKTLENNQYDPNRLRISSSSKKLNKNYYSNAPVKSKNQLMTNHRNQSLKCYCFYCNKDSPAFIDPPNLSKHSFASSKSSPQLDVISEEDAGAKDVRKRCDSIEGHPEPKSSSSSTKTRKQKTLEDSCAEFLSIVCDNILESVQKSVDGKLKEFTREASDKIEVLGEKMATNEASIKYLCSEVLEKITEENKKNFEVFYSRVQNLMENQKQMKSKIIQDNEYRSQQPIMDVPTSMGSSYRNDKKTAKTRPRRVNSPTPTDVELVEQKQPAWVFPTSICSSYLNETKILEGRSRMANSLTVTAVELVEPQPVWVAPTTISSLYPNDTNTTDIQPIASNLPTRTDVNLLPQQQSVLTEEKNFIPNVLSETNTSKILSNTTQSTEHEACTNINNIATDFRCVCCHCSNDNEEERFDHPCCPKEIQIETPIHPCENERETGGYINGEGKKWASKTQNETPIHSCEIERETGGCINGDSKRWASNKEDIKFHGLPLKCTAPTDSCKHHLSMQEIKLQHDDINHKGSCKISRSPTSTTFTTFGLTSPDKTILKCICCTYHQDGESRMMIASGSKTESTKSFDVKLNGPTRYDNYDTSGYASEPEDHNDRTASNSSRRKLIKKVSKGTCNCQNSDMWNAVDDQNKRFEKNSDQTITRRASGSSLKSPKSSSRLFRL